VDDVVDLYTAVGVEIYAGGGASATFTGETVGANAWGKTGAYVVEGAGA
jgi:hypothetical protein